MERLSKVEKTFKERTGLEIRKTSGKKDIYVYLYNFTACLMPVFSIIY